MYLNNKYKFTAYSSNLFTKSQLKFTVIVFFIVVDTVKTALTHGFKSLSQ